jgi:hypothetical protein
MSKIREIEVLTQWMLKRFATSVLIEPDRWIGFNEVEVHLVAQQLPDIAYPIPISVSVLFKIEAR